VTLARPVCPDDHKHAATSTCYTHHRCGCIACTEANTERRHMVSAGRAHVFEQIIVGRGVRRRLQALAAIGYSARRVSTYLDVTADQVLQWTTRDRVTSTTLQRVTAVYELLADHPPVATTSGERISINRARNQATLRGWARPIDWDDIDNDQEPQSGIPVDVDELAVELAVDGYHVTLTRAERHIAVTTLNRDRGYDDQVIARMLGVTDKTIARDREYLNLPAAVGPDGERIAA
jgi:hypothetical protein